MFVKTFINKLLDFIYYRRCYICGKNCTDIFLCTVCIDKVFSNLKFHKAEKYNTTIYCGSAYENELLKIIRALKYHRKNDFAQILAEIIIKTIDNYNLDISDYIICPVPIHKKRFQKRKYNHMELVAKKVAKHYNTTCNTTYFCRVKDTLPLYNLSFSEREQTIKNAFYISDEIKDKKILLLDDIVTTGSTIKEISSQVIKNSPQNFIVVCASRSNNCNF